MVSDIRKPCRHRRSWIVFGGNGEWCYECGALRMLESIGGTNQSKPLTRWAKPTGKDGKNPYDVWNERL